MSQKELSQLWKETVAARPSPRDIAKTMYLSTLSQAVKHSPIEGMHQIQSTIQDFILLEVKGTLNALNMICPHVAEQEVLWLCLQFHGKAVFPNGESRDADKLFSFVTKHASYSITLAAEKQWSLYLGVTGASRLQLLAELPQIKEAYDQFQTNMLMPVIISTSDRQNIESLFKKKLGPFSKVHQFGMAFFQFFENYATELEKPKVLSQGESLIQIYHNALAYVHKHCLTGELTREKIADALCCSTRMLNRAFEGRSLGLTATILAVKMYKARELLRTKPELSVEKIAGMLHFFDAKHFANHYKKHFHRSPREERKEWVEDAMKNVT